MSLISVKNFTAPVTNVVNLVAILGVVVLFGLWRGMGGGFDVHEAGERRSKAPRKKVVERSVPEVNDSMDDFNARFESNFGRRNDSLGSLLGDEARAKKPAARKPAKRNAAKQDDSASSLDDIERSLGLR